MKNYGLKFENSYLELPNEFYSECKPEPVKNPKIIIFNRVLADSLGLDFNNISNEDRAEIFSGNILIPGSVPFAEAYAGHQYGHFTMLGDGRAHMLGEHVDPNKHRIDIQLKGSGRTPYSRRGDGRATIGPMLREYIISEAMHALDIPTTRSLAVTKTGEDVWRDKPLPGAILTRIASSHIRVGTFEFAAAKDDTSLTEALLEYSINRHFPELSKAPNKALAFLEKVMELQINLITNWMRVGFIHGVMNTDNMAISGETIDYGPCAFMDEYNPDTVFSSIDQNGRYAFDNQAAIAQWNLARLAETLLPLISDDIDAAVKSATEIINKFPGIFEQKWLTMMRAKLGLFGEQENDKNLISDLLNWMHRNHADYTNTFLYLSDDYDSTLELYQDKNFQEWYLLWQQRLDENNRATEDATKLMKANNPFIIPRNHKVEQALESAIGGDIKAVKDLVTAIQYPYRNREENKIYQEPPAPNERVYQTFCGT